MQGVAGGTEPHSPPDVVSRENSPEEQHHRGPGRKRTITPASNVENKRIANKICRVCGDKAFSYNFNVITCESCKAFFRRNAFKENEIRCPFNEQCDITTLSRRFCQRCRLVKCFAVGMKKEWIMSDEARLEKKARVEENRERRMREAIAKGDIDEMPSHAYAPTACLLSSSQLTHIDPKGVSVKTAIRQRLYSESKKEDLKSEPESSQRSSSPDSAEKQSSIPSIPSIGSVGTPQSNPQPAELNPLPAPSATIIATPISVLTQNSDLTSQPTPLAVVTAPQVSFEDSLKQVVMQIPAMPGFSNITSQPAMNSVQNVHNITKEAANAFDTINNFNKLNMTILPQPQVPVPSMLPTSHDIATTSLSASTCDAIAQAAQAHIVAQVFRRNSMNLCEQQAQLQHQAQQMAAAVVASHMPQIANTLLPNSMPSQPLSQALPPQINLPTAPPIPNHMSHLNPMNQQLQPQVSIQTQIPQPLHTPVHPISIPPPREEKKEETVTIPKNMFIRLVEDAKRSNCCATQKCTCECRCGYYDKDAPIVEQVKQELEARKQDDDRQTLNSSNDATEMHPMCQDATNEMQRSGLLPSENSSVSWLSSGPTTMPGLNSYSFGGDDWAENPMAHEFEFGQRKLVPIDPECGNMNIEDHEIVLELMTANNTTWGKQLEGKEKRLHEGGNPGQEQMVNMAEGAIRRLVKMLKKLHFFQRLPQVDQMEIIRKNSMQYLVLRGAMAYDPTKNAWNGPTQRSGYNIKLDAMNNTENLLEHSIRFYSTFKDEHRTNEKLMLLLGQLLLLRNADFQLEKREFIEETYIAYRKCLKRLLFTINCGDMTQTVNDFNNLLDKIAQIQILEKKAIGMVRNVDSNSLEPMLRELFESPPDS